MGESKGRKLLRAFSDVYEEQPSSKGDEKDKGKKEGGKKQPPKSSS